jgi:hypothetical protein
MKYREAVIRESRSLAKSAVLCLKMHLYIEETLLTRARALSAAKHSGSSRAITIMPGRSRSLCVIEVKSLNKRNSDVSEAQG